MFSVGVFSNVKEIHIQMVYKVYSCPDICTVRISFWFLPPRGFSIWRGVVALIFNHQFELNMRTWYIAQNKLRIPWIQ